MRWLLLPRKVSTKRPYVIHGYYMLWHNPIPCVTAVVALCCTCLCPAGVLLQSGAAAAPLCDRNCAADVRPVCGADGRSYSNGCVAACAGVTVASEGYCAGQPASGAAVHNSTLRPPTCIISNLLVYELCNVPRHSVAVHMSSAG